MSIITEEKKKKNPKKSLSNWVNCVKHLKEGLHWMSQEWPFYFYMTLSYWTSVSHFLNVSLCSVSVLAWLMGNKEIPGDRTLLWGGDLNNQSGNSMCKWWTFARYVIKCTAWKKYTFFLWNRWKSFSGKLEWSLAASVTKISRSVCL